jgi:L-histidine Nalpha-methyltransferase
MQLSASYKTACSNTVEVVSDLSELAEAVAHGLNKCPKQLPFTLLYDELGSAIFEAITKLPEYALTMAEDRLYRRHASSIAGSAPFETLIELGSGSGAKTRILLEALLRRHSRIRYCAIDASPAALAVCRESLSGIIGLSVETYRGDFLPQLAEAREAHSGPALVVFGGSSIGNFDDADAAGFLHAVRERLREGDMFLLGADSVNAPSAMLRAYNDPIGLTASFCKNVLARINRELGGNFDLNEFRYAAHWCEARSRLEMRLQCLSAQRIVIPGAGVCKLMQPGDYIVAETSRKFHPDELIAMIGLAGFALEKQWVDTEWKFAETFASVPSRAQSRGLGSAGCGYSQAALAAGKQSPPGAYQKQ